MSARGGDTVRIAFVHDWLTGMRGGERVLEALCERYPSADVFTLVHTPGSVSPVIERHRIVRSFVGRLPSVDRYYRYCLLLFPLAVEMFALGDYDLVVSSSHCVAKSAVVPGRARHLCYCHSPMRYAWDQFDQYFGPRRLGWATALARVVMQRLAAWDAATADRPDRYLANSQHVAGRIARHYGRQATVVYPPVNTKYFHPSNAPPESFALVVSALVPYKRVELAVEACRLARVPLKVVGQGPERARLERAAGGHVEFLGPLPDDKVRDLYQCARVVILPGKEDFGIVPVEAQACGRPVVALGEGGALESVVEGVSGFLVPEPTPEAFAEALAKASQTRFDSTAIRANAERFSKEVFVSGMERHINDLIQAPEASKRT